MAGLIYFASGVGSDPLYSEKKAVLSKLSPLFHFPLERGLPSFEQTKADILDANWVLTDLSTPQPSVYFELGLVLGIGIPVVVVAKFGSTIHQTGDDPIGWYEDLDGFTEIVSRHLAKA